MKGEAVSDSSVERRAHTRSNLKACVDLPDRALVVKLQSLVAANNDHIASLQAELHQSRKASSKQISDVQEAYSKKVVALRRECDQQTAALEAERAAAEQARQNWQDAQARYQQELAGLRAQLLIQQQELGVADSMEHYELL
ncbi:hypothetical protein WJX73_009188 [Symbiochloris irregularis]|uniref:Uncharacterized protein n=1 Tax=Symbiochloris irregularis TaxID=706552 RepID=A0AAW1P4F2_9CHLO